MAGGAARQAGRGGDAILGHQPAAELSTGERRLVELARCLAGPFDLLLLDEPSSGLDQEETASFGTLLLKVAKERGCGVLLVEHDISLVLRVCEYVYVMEAGGQIFSGTPAEMRKSAEVERAYLGPSPEREVHNAV